jgi:hypothetical protein
LQGLEQIIQFFPHILDKFKRKDAHPIFLSFGSHPWPYHNNLIFDKPTAPDRIGNE